MKATISPYLIKKIVNVEHHDPFSILGMHSVKMNNRKAIAVRAYCPEANNLYIIPQNELFEKREMNLIQDEEQRFKRLVELNVMEQCINVIKTAEVQRAFRERKITVHGWVFDIHSGKLIDLKIDFNNILKNVMEIYKLE